MDRSDVDQDILELIQEEVDQGRAPEDEPVDALTIRLGQVQRNEDPGRPDGGYWLASAGWADKELDGLRFADRTEARRQAKEYVALLVQGRIKDFFVK